MCTDYDWPGARVDYQEISSQYLVLGIEVFTMGAYANVNLSDAKLCLLIYKNIFAAAKDLCPVHYRALFISSLNGAPRSLSKDEWTLGVDIQCGHYHYSALLHSPCSSACKHGAIMKGGFCGLSMRCPNNNDDPRAAVLGHHDESHARLSRSSLNEQSFTFRREVMCLPRNILDSRRSKGLLPDG